MSTPPPYISAEQCASVLSHSDVIDQIRQVLAWDAAGTIQWPEPRNLNIAPDKWGNDYHMKACVLEEIPVAGLRMVSHPLDESSPQCTRLIILIDPMTCLPLALVDETWNYAQRTVASIVLGVHSVANPGAATLAIVGSGRLARSSIGFFDSLFDLKQVRLTSRTPERRDAFADDLADHDFDVVRCDTAQEALDGADLVLTATSADQAVIDDAWVGPGAVVAAVGTAEPGRQYLAATDLFLVDSREQLKKELIANYGAEAPDWVTATVGEVIAGQHPGRSNPEQRALIVTEGMASQDIALAQLAYERILGRSKES